MVGTISFRLYRVIFQVILLEINLFKKLKSFENIRTIEVGFWFYDFYCFFFFQTGYPNDWVLIGFHELLWKWWKMLIVPQNTL